MNLFEIQIVMIIIVPMNIATSSGATQPLRIFADHVVPLISRDPEAVKFLRHVAEGQSRWFTLHASSLPPICIPPKRNYGGMCWSHVFFVPGVAEMIIIGYINPIVQDG